MPIVNNKLPPLELTTQSGAELLAKMIRAWWADRGYDVWCEPYCYASTKRDGTLWSVRSNIGTMYEPTRSRSVA